MTKYDELKQRIEALNNGWSKEADDILDNIWKSLIKWQYISFSFGGCGICYEGNKGDIYIHGNHPNKAIYKEYDAKFSYSSQSEKMTAFKKALMWLLDNSNIKNEKQTKIDELKKEVNAIQELIEKLEKGDK